MEPIHDSSAARMLALLTSGQATPALFRTALMKVPAAQRDAWLNLVFGLDELPDDGPQLPRGCTPYLPCPVDALLRVLEHAEVQSGDVFVDVGSGIGRAAALAQLLTGAASIGVEIQPELVQASRALAQRLNVSRFSVVEGDAAQLTEFISIGSVFFLYCPFSGQRLERVLDGLARIAQTRPIRVCCVQLPLPSRPWLTPLALPDEDLAVYRSSPLRC
ncbi:MAG: methyltransferase domain-containing protein [Deltaproteobacteria bacterium]